MFLAVFLRAFLCGGARLCALLSLILPICICRIMYIMENFDGVGNGYRNYATMEPTKNAGFAGFSL